MTKTIFDTDLFLRLTEGAEDVPKNQGVPFCDIVAAIERRDEVALERYFKKIADKNIHELQHINDEMFRPFLYEKNASVCKIIVEALKRDETSLHNFAIPLYNKTCLLGFKDGTGRFVLEQIIPHAKKPSIKQIVMTAGYNGQESDLLFLLTSVHAEPGLPKNLSMLLSRGVSLRSEKIAEALNNKLNDRGYKILADMVGCQCRTMPDLRFLIDVTQKNPNIQKIMLQEGKNILDFCATNEMIAKDLMKNKNTQHFLYPHVTLKNMSYFLHILPSEDRLHLFAKRSDLWSKGATNKENDLLLSIAEEGDIPLLRIVMNENPDLLLKKHIKGQLKGHSLLSLTEPKAQAAISRELLDLGITEDTKNDPSKKTSGARKI